MPRMPLYARPLLLPGNAVHHRKASYGEPKRRRKPQRNGAEAEPTEWMAQSLHFLQYTETDAFPMQ